MSREPTLDDLIGAETPAAERQRLQHVHEMLLESGPPPELSDTLEKGPTLGMTLGKRKRKVRPRAMLLLAAATLVVIVFFGGYTLGGDGTHPGHPPVKALALQGTAFAPHAQGTLQVWNSKDGHNWPMTLNIVGLSPLPPHDYYEVYLVHNGKLGGSCGLFTVGGSRDEQVTVPLNSPYQLRPGDTWIVTRPGPGGAEPGQTVLRPQPTTA